MKLRMPPWVRIVLNNRFPRSQITTQLNRSGGLHFGPFRSRASAERFEAQFLELFQMRRCQEDLLPRPITRLHLRRNGNVPAPMPASGGTGRVRPRDRAGGRVSAHRWPSILESIARSRDRFSEEMMFEHAARQHKRYEKVQDVLRLRDELARDIDALHGVAITRSSRRTRWKCGSCAADGGARRSASISKSWRAVRCRSIENCARCSRRVAPLKLSVRERQEYLALLSRWYYSTWRDGEWLAFESFDDIPYRKMVNAISRVAKRDPGL